MADPLTPKLPWHLGAGGATTFTRHEAQKFARSLLESQAYRDDLRRRISSGRISPIIESMIWAYAYGKPIEQVQMTVVQGNEDLSALSVEQLLERAKSLSVALEEAQALEDAIPTEFRVA